MTPKVYTFLIGTIIFLYTLNFSVDHSIAESRYYEESKDHGVRSNSSRQSNGYFLRLGVSSKVWEKIVIVQCDLIYAVHHWLWSYSQDHFNINRHSKNDWETTGKK